MDSLDLNQVIFGFTKLSDNLCIKLANHGKAVAYVSLSMAKVLGYNESTIDKLYKSSLLHDIGIVILPTYEIEKNLDLDESDKNNHAALGYDLLKSFHKFNDVANIVRLHHKNWKKLKNIENKENLILSQIIFLADRIDLYIRKASFLNLENLLNSLYKWLEENKEQFLEPYILDVFCDKNLTNNEFWEHFFQKDLLDYNFFVSYFGLRKHIVNLEESYLIAFFANIIDRHSHFTKYHSAYVGNLLEIFSNFLGFDKLKKNRLKICGYFHDIGKLMIPLDILHKNSGLSISEVNLIKMHPIFSKNVLSEFDNFDEIANIVSLHHEYLDGSGYPFQYKDKQIPFETKILTISDIFCALTEPRSYRKPLNYNQAVDNLYKMSYNNKVDKELLSIFIEMKEQILFLINNFKSLYWGINVNV